MTGGGGGGKKKKGKGNRKTRPAFVPKSSEDNLEFDDELARSVREADKIMGTTPTAATGNNIEQFKRHKLCLRFYFKKVVCDGNYRGWIQTDQKRSFRK